MFSSEYQGLSQKKKSALINKWENIAYWEECEQSKVLANSFGLS